MVASFSGFPLVADVLTPTEKLLGAVCSDALAGIAPTLNDMSDAARINAMTCLIRFMILILSPPKNF